MPPHQINRRGLSRSFQVTNIFPGCRVWENIRCAVLWSLGYSYAFWRNVDDLPTCASGPKQILEDDQPDRPPPTSRRAC